MPEFRASILAGNAGMDEIPPPLPQRRWDNNEHFFLLLWVQDKSNGNKPGW
jgi:hypothetical protein